MQSKFNILVYGLYEAKMFDKRLTSDKLINNSSINNKKLASAFIRKWFKKKGYIFLYSDILHREYSEINESKLLALSKSGEEKLRKFEKQYPEYFI